MVRKAGLAFEPSTECPACPRLVALRGQLRQDKPADWHNAPVPGFGPHHGRLLIVGLAPGLNGANRTGRPFTGDYAGDLLYATLLKFGWAEGEYHADPADGLQLRDCRLTNAVRCLPPANKPVGSEIAQCRPYLRAEIDAMVQLRAIIALGRIAHAAVLVSLGHKASAKPFAHGAMHHLRENITLLDSYHCSRYNTNTRRLTIAMFEDIFYAVDKHLSLK